MKRLTIPFLLFFVVSVNAQEITFKQFYKKHKKQADVSLNIPSFLARMFIDKEDIEDEKLFEKATNFKILVFENNPNQIVNAFQKFVKKSNLKTLIRLKDGKDQARIYLREKKGYIREIIISAGNKEEELVLLGLKTKITKDDLATIISNQKHKIASK